jgi:ornithine cyclodeaminase/alanine dehydrogenase
MCDGSDGTLLALIDSIEITTIRTGAATAVAAKYLACPGADTATICGCGNQGRISLKALLKTRLLKTVYVFDIERIFAEKLSADFSRQVKVIPIQRGELSMALKQSGIVVTCTPSTKPFIRPEDIALGTFVAAVGADSENKQELFSDLFVGNKIVVDVVDQSAAIGELHHAIREKKVSIAAVHAELGMIVAGKKAGRESRDEIIIFDSTGMALQDVAAASFVYEKALEMSMGVKFRFAESPLGSAYETSINQRHLRALRSWFPFR